MPTDINSIRVLQIQKIRKNLSTQPVIKIIRKFYAIYYLSDQTNQVQN